MANENPIQHLDLVIRLPKASEEPLQQWLNQFVKEFPYVNVAPRLENSTLTINSHDLVEFTGYWNATEISPFELEKIRAEARQQLQMLEQKAISQKHRYHYQWCQAALKNLTLGRHLKNASNA